MTEVLKVSSDEERDRDIYAAGFIPGWIGEGAFQTEPQHDFLPASWRWEDGRRLLDKVAQSIDPKVAERRNIRMANPAQEKRTTLNTIHASYQMVGPGEFARAHRHTFNAARFILESDEAYSTLDGEKAFMEPNDIILTPNWVWHGLGNESSGSSAYWIDLLDDPLASVLKTSFFEVRDEDYQNLPVNDSSPYHFKWRDLQPSLAKLNPEPEMGMGRRLKLETPSIASMDMFLEQLDNNIKYEPAKSTANHIFVVAEGEGTTKVDGKSFAWQRGDVVAVPSWTSYSHWPSTDATLLEVTDQPVMEALGWFRTE